MNFDRPPRAGSGNGNDKAFAPSASNANVYFPASVANSLAVGNNQGTINNENHIATSAATVASSATATAPNNGDVNAALLAGLAARARQAEAEAAEAEMQYFLSKRKAAVASANAAARRYQLLRLSMAAQAQPLQTQPQQPQPLPGATATATPLTAETTAPFPNEALTSFRRAEFAAVAQARQQQQQQPLLSAAMRSAAAAPLPAETTAELSLSGNALTSFRRADFEVASAFLDLARGGPSPPQQMAATAAMPPQGQVAAEDGKHSVAITEALNTYFECGLSPPQQMVAEAVVTQSQAAAEKGKPSVIREALDTARKEATKPQVPSMKLSPQQTKLQNPLPLPMVTFAETSPHIALANANNERNPPAKLSWQQTMLQHNPVPTVRTFAKPSSHSAPNSINEEKEPSSDPPPLPKDTKSKGKGSKASVDGNNSVLKRAFTAYNIFFAVEREKILNVLPEDCADLQDEKDRDARIRAVLRRLETKLTREAEEDIEKRTAIKILKEQCETTAAGENGRRGGKAKRKHRKSHGKVGFVDMTYIISRRWKALPEAKVNWYKDLGRMDLLRFQKARDEYNSSSEK